jgi:hypothetical protein
MKTTVKSFPVADRWCVHAYYTLCPYAPDGSGRFLLAGADPASGYGEVLVLSAEGQILDRFGWQPVSPSFWHTGFWQSWSPDGCFVYYQSGTIQQPFTVRRELATGEDIRVSGDVEGFPPSGEPALSCSHGMLYAAGYGDGRWKPELSPVPFLERDRHGITAMSFKNGGLSELVLSTQAILDQHPERARILQAEAALQAKSGKDEGLTLMTYCLRWNPQGTRFLFYFGNHNVVQERGEPKLAYVFTSDREMKNIRLALDLSFGRYGVHWGWQADGKTLIGYGPDPDGKGGACMAEVKHDGTGYRKLADHTTGQSGRHPSVSPSNPDLLVTDETTEAGGAVVFFSRESGKEIARVELPKFHGEREPGGRNAERVCHHPVFSPDGSRLLCNTLPGPNATAVEIACPQ